MSISHTLAKSGIEVQADGDRLIVDSPAPLSEKWRTLIRENKKQLLEEIRQRRRCEQLKQHAEDLELPLLPEDLLFVNGFLACCSCEQRALLLTEYSARWIAAADSEPLEHAKANAGRCAANTWLRKLH